MKLDKSKPYGQISGEHSAMFEQNGAFFDAHGDEVVGEDPVTQQNAEGQDTPPEPTTPKVPKAKPNKPGRKAAAETAPTTPVDEQIAAQTGA